MATTPETAVRYRDGVAVVDLPAQIDSTAERALNDSHIAEGHAGGATVPVWMRLI